MKALCSFEKADSLGAGEPVRRLMTWLLTYLNLLCLKECIKTWTPTLPCSPEEFYEDCIAPIWYYCDVKYVLIKIWTGRLCYGLKLPNTLPEMWTSLVVFFFCLVFMSCGLYSVLIRDPLLLQFLVIEMSSLLLNVFSPSCYRLQDHQLRQLLLMDYSRPVSTTNVKYHMMTFRK